MTIKPYLLRASGILLSLLAVTILLLLAGRHLFTLISPFALVLDAGAGVLLLIAVLWLPTGQSNSAAEGK
jgi:hypothetical protein